MQLSQMQIIGVLEQNMGQARVAFSGFANFPEKHFGGMSESEWLESPKTNINHTAYTEYVRARERLELWEFLVTAAQNWQPGDNVVDTWNNNQDDAVPPGDIKYGSPEWREYIQKQSLPGIAPDQQ